MAIKYKDGSTIHQLNDANGALNYGIGTYHLAANENLLYDVQRTNNFELIVPVAGLVSLKTGLEIPNADEIIRVSVISTGTPSFSQQAIEVQRGNNSIKFAGVPRFNDISFTLNDYIGADTLDVLQAWQSNAYDINTQKVGLVTDYKVNCWLNSYSPDYQLVNSWVLHGCWIGGLNIDEFSNERNDKKRITANLYYDWYEVTTDEEM